MRKRRRISTGTIGNHDDEEGEDEEKETSIKYPGSDKDQKVCSNELTGCITQALGPLGSHS